MSDIEEPPTKVTKYEMSQTFTQPEEMDEGQEEWLSEGLLTDDDINPGNSTDPDRTRSDLDSQGVPEDTLEDSIPEETLQEEVLNEEVLESLEEEPGQDQSMTEQVQQAENGEPDTQKNSNLTSQEATAQAEDAQIEQTLNSMNNTRPETEADALDEFLRKNEGEEPPGGAKEESDGNDTDDLLRMLEGDDKSKKTKVTKPAAARGRQTQQADEQSTDEEDDEYIFDGATVRKLKVAQNALLTRKVAASRAKPETTDEDSSSDEAGAVRKVFNSRGTTKASAQQPKRVAKQVVRVGQNNATTNTSGFLQTVSSKKPASSTPLRQYGRGLKAALEARGTVVRLLEKKGGQPERKLQPEHEEIINEEEFLEEDIFDLGEEFAEESDSELDKRASQQRIMKPEMMDEEIPSDAESHDDDGSIYDFVCPQELPSSESDDMEEWFSLDVRSERAGDYLPLLGSKAYDMLMKEKARVSTRIATLRESLTALNATGKQQAEKLRRATAALAEVDDMLKAA